VRTIPFSFFVILSALILLSNSEHKKYRPIPPEDIGRWTGTMTLHKKVEGATGSSDLRVTVSFINALPTLYRDENENPELDFKDDKGTGTSTYHAEGLFAGKKTGVTDCKGTGLSELHEIVIDLENKEYSIQASGPICKGQSISYLEGVTRPYESEDVGISTGVQPLTNKNVLDGTKSWTGELVGGLGTGTTTIIWHLERTTNNNAELIVTPEDYDNWLPKPGRDELTKGTVMNINLKVKSTNGKPLSIKAKSFELTLSNTSVEPGITINYPVSPRAKQLPDLRFLPVSIAESIEEDQFISLPCHDGSTGKVIIGSYDGGGWTTLTAEAILEDDTRIKGHLLISGGEQQIRIPKRDKGSIIATSWLKANKDPGEMDDKEESNGNENKGDGLTAYEEYRGVVSMDTFRRLSPIKKELGLLIKQSEYGFFKEGFRRFENASDIKIYVFGQNEIPDNRRLNQNAKSAHDFKQFVLRLNKGNNNGEKDIYGANVVAWGVAYPKVDIPARVTHISIDVDRIRTWYQGTVRAYGAHSLPFTDRDLVASTTAHEIGHGVNLPHHGRALPNLPGDFNVVSNPPRIYNADATGSWEVTDRPWTIDGAIGSPGNNESGNVSCFMCYRNKVTWVRIITDNNELVYYRVPWLAAGILFCPEIKGTGINADNKYFGNGISGNCLGHIKLRD